MANPTIGEIKCPHETGCLAEVRKCVTGRQLLYYVCRHGKITPNLQPGQDWILDNAKMYGSEGPPAPQPITEKPVAASTPVEKPEVKPAPEKPPEKSGEKPSALPAKPVKKKGVFNVFKTK